MTKRLNYSLLFIIPILGILAFLFNFNLPAIDLYITKLTISDNKLNLLSFLPVMLFWRNFPEENINKVILLSLVMFFADLGLLTILPIISVLILDKNQSQIINLGNILIFVMANILKLFNIIWFSEIILMTCVLLIILNIFLNREKDYYFYYQVCIYISIMRFIDIEETWLTIIVPFLVLSIMALCSKRDKFKKSKTDEVLLGSLIFILLPIDHLVLGLFLSFIMLTNYKEFKESKVDHSLSSLIIFLFMVIFLTFTMNLNVYVFIMFLAYILIKSEDIICKIKSFSSDLFVITNLTILLLMCFINYWNIQ